MIADDVVSYLKDSQIFAMAEVVKPGFINLRVKEEFLGDYLKKMAADEKYSVKTAEKPKTIIILSLIHILISRNGIRPFAIFIGIFPFKNNPLYFIR